MKLSISKDMTAERLKARAELDEVFLPRISEVLGPKAALYAAKYAAALAGSAHDAEAIIAKHEAATAKIMQIEARRQELQGRIDAARTTFELQDILTNAQGGIHA